MLTGFTLKIEHIELCRRRDFLAERLRVEGFTDEIKQKMIELQKDVDDLEQRTKEELMRLGLR